MRTLLQMALERLLQCMAYPNFNLQVPVNAVLFYVFSALAAGLPANEDTLLKPSLLGPLDGTRPQGTRRSPARPISRPEAREWLNPDLTDSSAG